MNARLVQVERAAEYAVRDLRRLERASHIGGCLMLAMAASSAIAEIEEAKERELSFRRDLEGGVG